jgi:hypothetical protein
MDRMADRQKIIDAVDSFYDEIIMRYKDLELEIAGESRIFTIFKKVDYKSRIIRFKDLKRKAQTINVKKIAVDKNDELAVQVREKLEKSITLFNHVVDAQVSCQTFLLKKSEGEKTDKINYKKAVYQLNQSTEELQNHLRNMDADYANLEE